MRKIIAALQVSLDGFIEGPHGEFDWIDTWEDPFELTPQIDTCILGGGMYPGYEHYWSAVIANPAGIPPFTGRSASQGEIDYARFAAHAPHVVLSTTLAKVAWKNTRVVRDIEDIRALKQQPGKDMHAVGGATLVSNLINLGLINELRLVIIPIVLGGGKALFKDVTGRHPLKFIEAKPLNAGMVRLTYCM